MPAFMTTNETKRINEGHCPDCGYRGFVLGPRGGAGMNIECGGCAARFNIAQFTHSHHIVMAHRIPRESEGGSNWNTQREKSI